MNRHAATTRLTTALAPGVVFRATPSLRRERLPGCTSPKQSETIMTRRGPTAVVAAASVEPTPLTPLPNSVASLKSSLLDALYGTNRGLSARGETKARINECITQLEAQNPTPSPTSVYPLLSFSRLTSFLGHGDVKRRLETRLHIQFRTHCDFGPQSFALYLDRRHHTEN